MDQEIGIELELSEGDTDDTLFEQYHESSIVLLNRLAEYLFNTIEGMVENGENTKELKLRITVYDYTLME